MNNYPKTILRRSKLKSYQEIIKDDQFDIKESHQVGGHLPKMCWKCETKQVDGCMVKDTSKGRLIFFCKECFEKIKS